VAKTTTKNNLFTLHQCNDRTCNICSNDNIRSDVVTLAEITPTRQEVKQETLERLTTIEDDIKNSKSDDKYVKFNDGDKKVFQFLPDESKIIYKKYAEQQNKFDESEYQNDKDYKKYYRFAVYDPNIDKQRIWDCSNWKAAQDVIRFLKQGINFLKIKRIGDKKNTVYDVEPGSD
jgi:hypothetical protein